LQKKIKHQEQTEVSTYINPETAPAFQRKKASGLLKTIVEGKTNVWKPL